MVETPPGATHFSDFYGSIGYWCVRQYSRGVESGEPFYAWHSWNGTGWQRESFVNDDRLYPLHAKGQTTA